MYSIMILENLRPEMINVRNGLIFESIVLISLTILLLIVISYNRKKQSDLTFLLLLIFICFTCGMVFSWMAKLLYWVNDINSLSALSTDATGYFFYKLIFKYRLAFISLSLGAYINDIFRNKVFKKEDKGKKKIIIRIYCVFYILFNILVMPADDSNVDIISFALMFLLMIIVYIPFIKDSFKLAKRIEKGVYKTGLLSLGLMGICFIMISINMVIDRAMIIFFDSDGYTFFYYAGWTGMIFGCLSAYIGFIRPAAYKEQVSETN
jgi:hypothetical protein